mmetsp:Transcript_17004/g.24066  ORF Transcript_17004/g.24066 Transcript_17004/m.24066 type:complete len:146 (+) Transcript_17004:377-814(+)
MDLNDEDDFDLFINDNQNPNYEDEEQCYRNVVHNEINALRKLKAALINAQSKYSLDDESIKKINSNQTACCDSQKFSAILVKGEKQIISLHLSAIDEIKLALEGHVSSFLENNHDMSKQESYNYVHELAVTFLKIRHPNILQQTK